MCITFVPCDYLDFIWKEYQISCILLQWFRTYKWTVERNINHQQKNVTERIWKDMTVHSTATQRFAHHKMWAYCPPGTVHTFFVVWLIVKWLGMKFEDFIAKTSRSPLVEAFSMSTADAYTKNTEKSPARKRWRYTYKKHYLFYETVHMLSHIAFTHEYIVVRVCPLRTSRSILLEGRTLRIQQYSAEAALFSKCECGRQKRSAQEVRICDCFISDNGD